MQVPVATSRQRYFTDQSQGSISPIAPSRDLREAWTQGSGMYDAGNRILHLGQQMQERYDTMRRASDLSALENDATRQALDLQMQLEQDPDFRSAPQRFRTQMAEYRQAQNDAITDGQVRDLFNRSFDRIETVHEFDVRRTSRRREVDFGVARLNEQLDSYSEMLANAPNPAQYAQVRGQAQEAIQRAQGTGLITDVQAGERERAFLSRASEVQVRQRMRNENGLTQLYRDLLDPTQFRDLDERRRAELTMMVQNRDNTLRNQRIAEADRAERHAERDLRHTQDAVEVGLYGRMMTNNPPTAEELVQAAERGQISREGLERLNRARLSNAQGQTDNTTMYNLITEIHSNSNPDETRRHILEQVSGGRLSQNDFQQLMQMSYTTQRQDWQTSEQHFYFERIKDDLGASNPLAVTFTREEQANYARASIEYYQRIQGGEAPRDVYQDISTRFRQVDPSSSQLPIPRGSTTRPTNTQELQAAGQRLRDMHNRRELSDADFNREIGYLQLWQQYIQRRPTR